MTPEVLQCMYINALLFASSSKRDVAVWNAFFGMYVSHLVQGEAGSL